MKQVSIPTLKRLPSYYNIISAAIVNYGKKYISSSKIAKELNIDDTQVRKDIAATGYVGKPKVGFDTFELKLHLEQFLGFNKLKEAYLIGAGNLGVALAKYEGFKKFGLDITAIFDNNPAKIGTKVQNKQIYCISRFQDMVSKNNVKFVIITIPASAVSNIIEIVESSQIKAIWNFSPVNLKVNKDIIVLNQDLATSFVTLVHLLNTN